MGTMASAEAIKTTSVWPKKSATAETGRKTSSQSIDDGGRRLTVAASWGEVQVA